MVKLSFMRKSISILALISSFAVSCKYNEIVEASYPDQKIYFPAAREGRFTINSVAEPGKPFRYEADQDKFNIPLSVFRGAVRRSGAISVNIQANNDTINSLITDGTLLNTELLPADQYTIPTTVQIDNGQENAQIAVSINMAYLVANAGKLKALCLKLSSSSVSTNPALDKLVLLIDPIIFTPVASFQATPKTGDPKTISFNNQSKYALKYSWNFGDNGTSELKSPEHKYTAAGTYEVTLTAEGIAGAPKKHTYKTTITVL
jgi:hypothetical protein